MLVTLPPSQSVIINYLWSDLCSTLISIQRYAKARTVSQQQLSQFILQVVPEILRHRAGHAILSGGKHPRERIFSRLSTLVEVRWWRCSRGIIISTECDRISACSRRHGDGRTIQITLFTKPDDLEKHLCATDPERYRRLIDTVDRMIRRHFSGWTAVPADHKLKRVKRRWPRAALIEIWKPIGYRESHRWVLVFKDLSFRTEIFVAYPSRQTMATRVKCDPHTFSKLISARNDKEVIAAVLES